MKTLYMFWGKVIQGHKRGRMLGYPTINLRLHKKIPEGIYASDVLVDNKRYHAATFIGKAETYGEQEYKAESFILDFGKSIYGKWVTVFLYKKLRGNKKFSSEDALKKQIAEDVQITRKFFSVQ